MLFLAILFQKERVAMDSSQHLFQALREGDELGVKVALENGALADEMDADGETALIKAVLWKSDEIVKVLLAAGADPNKPALGNILAPLHWSVRTGRDSITKMLIDAGAELELTDPGGWTPLHVAAANGEWEAMELLLAEGADLEARTKRQETAMHLAAKDNWRECLEVLLDRGADVKARDFRGKLPRDYAKVSSRGCQELLDEWERSREERLALEALILASAEKGKQGKGI